MSTRFASAVAVLLALTLIPTLIHSYVGLTANDGLQAARIPSTLDGQPGSPTARRPEWVMKNFDSEDWIERRYLGNGDRTLFVVRSFDLKRLYHHPELAIAYGDSYAPVSVVRLPQRPGVPLHTLRSLSGRPPTSMYTLLYDGAYVEHPVAFQLRTSLELLFSRRKAMTLFFVRDASVQAEEPTRESAAARLLFDAMHAVETQIAVARR
jgi:hypothetical protein